MRGASCGGAAGGDFYHYAVQNRMLELMRTETPTAVVTYFDWGKTFGTGECLLHSLGDFFSGRAGSTSAPTDMYWMEHWGRPLPGSDPLGLSACAIGAFF